MQLTATLLKDKTKEEAKFIKIRIKSIYRKALNKAFLDDNPYIQK